MTGPRLRSLRSEEGLTLVEIVMAGFISLIVFAAFAGVLVSVQGTLNRESERSVANDHARSAIESVDRGVRSASNVFTLDAADEFAPSAFSLVAYVEEHPQPGDPPRCVQWTVDDDRQLLRRTWNPNESPLSPSAWQVVATDIVNRDVSGGPVPAFAVPVGAQSTEGGRTVEVTMMANPALASQTDATVTIESSITARNARAPAGTPPTSPLNCPPPA